ncbi:MAG: DNA mismatch repair endonuclease MutL [Rickettsiales bacterium]|nr:DNA mismatch repair endonuclease MutL [Rickettsiales bacterium]
MVALKENRDKQRQIIKLSPVTISRIAAGEAVERPASVVKELIENSLDAGASEITVRIENTGKGLISISDNGCGMDEKDLSIAVESHTTSKLKGEDLINIAHLGFRGEAIASIGSISRLTIKTCTKNNSDGVSITVIGGQKTSPMPIPHHIGTTVEVRDLFYATPARLKFLRKDKTESHHIENVINKIAIAHPKVAFKLYSDSKLILNYSSVDLIDSRAARISEVLGKEFLKNSIPINDSAEDIKLSGYICLPTYARSTYVDQYLYVNNRAVRDKLLLIYVKNAYQDFLSRDKYPMTVLFLDIPSELVDVNVHPAKAEVRFRDVFSVKNLVVGSLKRALEENSAKTSSTISTNAVGIMADTIKARMPDSRNTTSFRKDFGSNNTSSPSQFYESVRSFNAPRETIEEAKQSFNISEPCVKQTTDTFNIQDQLGIKSKSSFNTEPQSDMQEELIYDSSLFGFPKAQLHSTYIISQTKDGIIIVDQHAAHERVCYEKLKKQIKGGNIESQPLLVPEVIELDNLDVQDKVLNLKDSLFKSGLKIEYHSKKIIKVIEVPSVLINCDIKELMAKIINNVLDLEDDANIEVFINKVLATYSCHYSIRAGRQMQVQEMAKLFKEMEATPGIGQCNHGRPTYIELKLKDIKKLFERS